MRPLRLASIAAALLLAGDGRSQPYVPGQTYSGAHQYIEYRAGDLPVIITAPHGGNLTPADIPNRVPVPGQDVVTVTDANTADLARRIADAIHERTGRHAHLVLCLLARTKLDANRELAVAAQGNATAGAAWHEYHGFITAARRQAEETHGFSFLVDQHGHGHAVPRLELGYNLGNATLALGDAALAAPRYQWDSYFRTLPLFRPETGLPELLRGPRSLGEFFSARGFAACPSPRDPSPADAAFFSGGYTTDTHTCLSDNGPGHGVQIEAHFPGVRDSAASRQRFALAVAEALNQFLFDSYGYVLGTGPVFRFSAPAEDLHAGGAPVGVTVTRDGFRGAAESIAINFGGSARRGADYTAPATVTFTPGQAASVLVLAPAPLSAAADAPAAGDRSIELSLAPDSLQAAAPAPLRLPLGDGRTPTVRVAAAQPRVSEADGIATFRLTRTHPAEPLTVTLEWSGDAATSRVLHLSGELAPAAAFAAGERELLLSVPLINDTTLRPTRHLRLALRPGIGYAPGGSDATIEIVDDDTAPGLALWLPGTVSAAGFRDESGAGRHAASQPAGRGPAVVSAPGGVGINFNGTDQALQLPRFSLDPARAFSLAFRFRLPPGAAVSNRHLAAFGVRGAPGTFQVHLASATTLRTHLVDATGGTAAAELDTSGPWSDGAWRHYALVVDAQGGRRVFIDGLPVRHAPGWSGPLNPTAQLWLGWHPQNAAGGHLNGGLADVRVYSRALAAAEVEALATGADAGTGRLANLSIRTAAGFGDETLIAGFVVGGASASSALPLLVRGVGPTLAAFGIGAALADPAIALLREGTPIATNDDWGGAAELATAFAAVGAFALDSPASRDAALWVPALAPGAYSVQLHAATGATGLALAELYDATPASHDAATASRLVNLSARARVGAGDAQLLAGFLIAGEGPVRVLLRAIGPTLATFGVASALADPQLTLYRDRTVIATNDDWGDHAFLVTAGARVGAFALPPASADAALLVTLPPGTYSAGVAGAGGSTGVALLELYEVAPP